MTFAILFAFTLVVLTFVFHFRVLLWLGWLAPVDPLSKSLQQ